MACFLVPAGEAVATTIIQKVVGKERAERLKMSWLNLMLWGGVTILAIEHVWHGEVVPWPPFLTAMRSPQDIQIMLHEMMTIGTLMAVAVTIVWIAMVVVSIIMEKKTIEPRKTKA